MLAQRTLRTTTRAVGVGVHGGQKVELVLHPAPEDSGIVFRRVDCDPPVAIPAVSGSVCDTQMATSLSPGGDPKAPCKVRTVEHLLSACVGLGLDNLAIDISGEEVPILDGSAASFVFLLQGAGIALQAKPKRFIRVTRRVQVEDGDKWARLEPHAGYSLGFEIEFDHPAVARTGRQFVFEMGSGRYTREIARARTFGFAQEVDWMRSRGLGLGGSLDNVVVVDEKKVLNSDGLRYDDEFVKHKILDAIGDMALAGRPLIAAYRAFKSGHALNHKLVSALLADPSCWETVTFEREAEAPAGFAALAPAW